MTADKKAYEDRDRVRVEAMQVPPKPIHSFDMLKWVLIGAWLGSAGPWTALDAGGGIELRYGETPSLAANGDWIVKHADGQCSAMTDEFFRSQYSPA